MSRRQKITSAIIAVILMICAFIGIDFMKDGHTDEGQSDIALVDHQDDKENKEDKEDKENKEDKEDKEETKSATKIEDDATTSTEASAEEASVTVANNSNGSNGQVLRPIVPVTPSKPVTPGLDGGAEIIVPTPIPDTGGEPVMPTPDPEVKPTPDPEVKPTPDPEVKPTPDPETKPTPDPEVKPTPDPEKPITTENVLFTYEDTSIKVYAKSDDKTLADIKSELLAPLAEAERARIYFSDDLLDDSKVLVVDPDALLTTEREISADDLPALQEGIYLVDANSNLVRYAATATPAAKGLEKLTSLFTAPATDENGLANLPSNKEIGKEQPIILIAGKVTYPERTIAAQRIIGYPGNETHLGVSVFGSSQVVSGINFVAEDTIPSKSQNFGFISVTKNEALDATITNNSFKFSGEAPVIKALVAYSGQGALRFTNNTISGKSTVPFSSANHGMVHFIERSDAPFKLTISNNIFTDIKSSAVRMIVGENEDVQIHDNQIDGVEDCGLAVSVFPVEYPKQTKLTITANQIKNYGLGFYENYNPEDWGGPLIPVNTEESGISINFAEQSYGSYINKSWTASESELTELLTNENQVMTKQQNDKNPQVVDSSQVLVGPNGRVIDTKARINKAQYGNKRHVFVITKNENGSVTYGQNPNDLTEEIEVGGVYITGSGTGVVVLPSTLKIKGDLVIDLPNGKVQNQAVVQGTTTINAESQIENDALFAVEPASFIRGEAPAQGVAISISEVVADNGTALTANNTNWDQVAVFANGEELASSAYQLDEASDTIYIAKAVADTWQEEAQLMVRIASTTNQVSPLNSNRLTIAIQDDSDFRLEWSKEQIIHMNPDNEEIVIAVKDIKDKFGQPVSAADSQLTADFIKGGMGSLKDFLTIDDAKDEITLSAELLKILPATTYTQAANQSLSMPLTDVVTISAPESNVAEQTIRLPFKVVDHSRASFVFEKGLTFTQGNAPSEGIKLYITNIIDTNGHKVAPADSVIQDHLNIEPFPVNRDDTEDSEIIVVRDEDGNYVKEIFNPKFIVIDDANDTVTFTQEYLNKMKTKSDASTESGMKIFTFIYKDTTACVSMRTNKTPLYIKKEEVAKSTDLTFSFKADTYQIENQQIVTAGAELSEDTMVSTIYAAAIKANPRQQILIETKDGAIRPDYASVEKGDQLLVKAEDTTQLARFPLVLADSKKSDLISVVTENVVDYDNASMKVAPGLTVAELLASITLTEGATAEVLAQDGSSQKADAIVTHMSRLRITKNGLAHRWNLVPFRNESQSRAILIGNWDYAGDDMDLVGPKTDLQMMETIFTGNNLNDTKTEVTKLYNVLKQDFAAQVADAFAGATEEDTSYIYYSGHGNNINGVSYICTVDNKILPDGNLDPSAWISVNELRTILDQVPGKKVLILDCCNAGGFIGKEAIGVDDAAGGHTRAAKATQETQAVFVKDVKQAFTKDNTQDGLNYLTTDDYKVLVASSANEYSYEDVQLGLGKFTRALAVAAGLENNQMAGDRNQDKILDLDEAYQYLMENVASISHIQVFPYKEAYPLFKDVQTIALSDVTSITSDNYQVITASGGRGMIKPLEGEVISSEQTVAEFLAQFTKGEAHQQLSVVYLNGQDFQTAKTTDKLGTSFKYLQVEAQNGDVRRYSFLPKKPIEKSDNTDISTTNPAIEIITNPYATSIKLTKDMEVGTFLQAIQKGHDKQTLAIYPKGSQQAKPNFASIANLDRLEVIAEDGTTKKQITILFQPAVALLPEFGESFTVIGKEIHSAKVSITTDMTVGEFIKEWTNKNSLNIDRYVTGVYPKGAVGPFVRKKQATEQLVAGDIFRLKPFDMFGNKPVVDYTIIVEAGESGGGGEVSELPIPNWGWRCKLDGNAIVEEDESLNNSVKFGTLVGSWLENKSEFTSFEFTGAYGMPKTADDFLEDGAKIRFFKGDASIEYSVKFNTGGGIVIPPAGGGTEGGGGGFIVVPPVIIGG